ncbi:MAG: hypothetical protein IKP22_11160 [Clostridia bacterium]|nr:hypothetical protein [Clostridia bacterium]
MKKILAVLLAVFMTVSAASFSLAEEEYTRFPTPVMRNGERIGDLDLRFYPAAPHVAYYGIRDYLAFMYRVDVTVSAGDGGVFTVTNPNGSFIMADPAAGTIIAPDWALFQSPPVPYTGQMGVKDSPCAWTYYSDLVFEDAPKTVIFDFAKYGIPLYADENDVYLPLSLLSTMFTDLAVNYTVYNGETVFVPVLDMSNLTGLPEGFYEGKRMQALLRGKEQRAEDEINENYGELCFILDYFFGHPGTSRLDKSIAEKGLDAALREDLPGRGEELITGLRSPDMGDYLVAMSQLFFELLDDGHTAFTGISGIMNNPLAYPGLYLKLLLLAGNSFVGNSSAPKQQMMQAIPAQRAARWGNELYRECGSTAILRIDAFAPDIAGWEAYYAGRGGIPMDALGITWTGLKRASENPAIKNILFDLSANGGGSGDLLMSIIDLVTGDNLFRGYNVLTGQHVHAVVHTDKNLDGVIDEKDDEVKYDFNYGVLTTRLSFSCGNLFPFLMQDHGAVLIGEPTGGGSCCVQTAMLSGGAVFMMSSYMWRLETADGESLEDGCRTDLPIERIEPVRPTNENPRLSMGDYSAYFDDTMLDEMLRDWFKEAAEVPAA